jgi:anti-sigma regulatory factor (Ser/Thr protein kinase)
VTTAETSISNRRDDLARVTRIVDKLAASHHLAAGVVADVNVALDEVLTNIITYGYDDDRVHEIRIRLTVDDDAIEAEVLDDGRPFDPTVMSAPDRRTSLQERRVGGLGMHLVKNLMSEVIYSRSGDRNRLVLKRRLTDRSEEDQRGSA